MRTRSCVLPAAMAFAALVAGGASAQTAAPDATAPVAPRVYRLSPAEIARVQAEAANPDDPLGLDMARRDRGIHGEVSAGIGTGGYRSLSGVVGVPLGDSSSAILGFETGRFDNYRLGRQRYTGAYFGGSFGPGW